MLLQRKNKKMPHKEDFVRVTNLKEIRVNPAGWVNPLFIEYGLALHYNNPSYFWRIKGTEHTFIIAISRLEFLSSGEYANHFQEALEGFREDYIEWKDSEFKESWMKEYQQEYSRFIL